MAEPGFEARQSDPEAGPINPGNMSPKWEIEVPRPCAFMNTIPPLFSTETIKFWIGTNGENIVFPTYYSFSFKKTYEK